MVTLLYEELCGMIVRLSSPDLAHQFLADFLTETEKIMFSKRYMILVLLMRGYTVEDIKNRLYVSNSAVMSVASWYKNAHPGTTRLLAQINRAKNMQSSIDKIEALLEKIPSGKYQDRQRLNQEKSVNERSRKLRDALR